jgi:glycosyltransferase involved in cell wall biosynthesis
MTVERLVKGLLARGHRVQLIRPNRDFGEQRQHWGNLDVAPQPGFRIPFYPQVRIGLPVGRRLRRLWRKSAPDIVHVFTEGPLGAAAVSSARRLGLPLSSSFHTNFHTYSGYYGLGLLAGPVVAYLRGFHNRTACTLVPTAELARQLGNLGFRNLRILARGVDTDLFSPSRRDPALRPSWGVGCNDPVALYVGRLAAEKNLNLAVDVFLAMRAVNPRAHLVLVGDGPLAASLRVRLPEAVFCGMRTGENLAAHYASADIFLFPSLTETFGNVTLEAMASGLAVVAFDYAAAHCVIKHHHNGLLVPFRDAAAFIASARQLSGDPDKIRSLGREARRAAGVFAWERIYDELETVLMELIDSRRVG